MLPQGHSNGYLVLQRSYRPVGAQAAALRAIYFNIPPNPPGPGQSAPPVGRPRCRRRNPAAGRLTLPAASQPPLTRRHPAHPPEGQLPFSVSYALAGFGAPFFVSSSKLPTAFRRSWQFYLRASKAPSLPHSLALSHMKRSDTLSVSRLNSYHDCAFEHHNESRLPTRREPSVKLLYSLRFKNRNPHRPNAVPENSTLSRRLKHCLRGDWFRRRRQTLNARFATFCLFCTA